MIILSSEKLKDELGCNLMWNTGPVEFFVSGGCTGQLPVALQICSALQEDSQER